MGRRVTHVSCLSICWLLLACGSNQASEPAPPATALGGDSPLVPLFEEVAATRSVPAEVLATLAYVGTRLRFVPADAGGHSHAPGVVGMVGLTETDGPRSLSRAAVLSGLHRDDLVADTAANLHGAAALLAHYRDQLGAGDDLGDWLAVVREFAGHETVVEVMRQIELGWRGRDAGGREVVQSARPAPRPDRGIGQVRQAAGYPGALWSAAHASNYTGSSRGAADINYIVIHTTQGSYAGAISWFKNPSSNVSAHYVTRSSDGQITQMVDDADTAWHDACFNSETIGIEHEGWVEDPDAWYTEAMYTESARLTAWLAAAYGIPLDRAHIMGHGDAPDCSSHTDPGPGWDWDHYMSLVRNGGNATYGASYAGHSVPTRMTAGQEAVVWFEFVNESNVTWGLNETRLGTSSPHDRASPFYVDGNWLSPSRATGADHSTYNPGVTGRFTFLFRAPEVTEPTDLVESYQLIQEGVEWFGPEVTVAIRVVPEGWTEPDDPTDPVDPGSGSDPGDDPGGAPTAPGDPADEGDVGGGCSAGGGISRGPCAILLVSALLAITRRRRDG